MTRKSVALAAVLCVATAAVVAIVIVFLVGSRPSEEKFFPQLLILAQKEGVIVCLEEYPDSPEDSLENLVSIKRVAESDLTGFLKASEKRVAFDWERSGKLLRVASRGVRDRKDNPLNRKIKKIAFEGTARDFLDACTPMIRSGGYAVMVSDTGALRRYGPYTVEFPGGTLRELLDAFSEVSGLGWKVRLFKPQTGPSVSVDSDVSVTWGLPTASVELYSMEAVAEPQERSRSRGG